MGCLALRSSDFSMRVFGVHLFSYRMRTCCGTLGYVAPEVGGFDGNLQFSQSSAFSRYTRSVKAPCVKVFDAAYTSQCDLRLGKI